MTDKAEIASRYIDAWNERDPGRRCTLLAASLTDAATYIAPLMQGQGHAEIGALIEAVHQRLPGFRFTPGDGVDAYGDRVRFSWSLGPEGATDMIKGTDFAVLEDGRFKSIAGFLDRVPASA